MRALSAFTAMSFLALVVDASGCTFNTGGVNIGATSDGPIKVVPEAGVDARVDVDGARPDAPGDGPPTEGSPGDSAPPQPDACVLADSGLPPTTGLDAPKRAIMLDGKLDDWACATWHKLDANTADNVNTSGGSGGANPTISASWAVAWDKDAVYLAVRVNDDIIVGSDTLNVWKNDSVEIYVDGDGLLNGVYDTDTAQLLVDHAQRLFRGPTPQANPPGFNAIVTKVAGRGYNVEIRIEASSLLQRAAPLKVGDRLAFDIAVNDVDSDGGERTQLIWRDRGTLACTCGGNCCCGLTIDEPFCNSLHFDPLRLRP